MFEFLPREYPDAPGVYIMKDADGRILYVGKAISLRKRLSSYFRSPAGLSPKTRSLVERIALVEVLLVGTEKEALLLEESLIKKHKPRYNIVLRDDKRSLLFRLDRRAEYPRLTLTRQTAKDGAAYFGPYTSAAAARSTLKLINAIFPLRKCSDRMFKNRVRPCMYHHVKQCLGPCVLPVDAGEYAALVRRVELFLSGRSGELVRSLRKEMQAASEALAFERAALLRDQLAALEATQERQAAVLADDLDRDVAALAPSSDGLGLGLLLIRGGRLLDQKTFFWPGQEQAQPSEALESFLVQYYGEGSAIPPRIVVSHALPGGQCAEVLADRKGAAVRVAKPSGPKERQLMDMGLNLALHAGHAVDKLDIPALLERRLGLGALARRLECVDISHLAGQGVRAGVAVFLDGVHAPEESKVYALEGAEGTGDDYAALALWAVRRVASGPPWPDLLLIDGGRGQLGAVELALAEASAPKGLELAAIAKGPSRKAGELEDRIFRPGRKNPMPLKPGSQELLFLQRARDAAHRLVISSGRRASRKKRLASELLAVPGLGPALVRRLWDRYGSLDAMRGASVQDLACVRGVGPALAERLRAALGQGADDSN